jgi:Holliday junction resolvase RusA-like endonuclease
MSQDKTLTPVAAYSITILGNKSEYSLTIPGRLPGLNEYTDTCRTNPKKGNRMKQEHQTAIAWQIMAQMRRCKFQGPVFLLYHFYEKDRRRDKDNVSGFAHKVIQDALVQCGTLHDDGWDYVSGHADLYEVDKENPRIVVEFIEQEVAAKCKEQPAKSSKK